MIKINALIDTIFGPVLNWLTQILNALKMGDTPTNFVLNIGNIFRPLNMISPAWSLFLSNAFVLIAIYFIIYITMSGAGLYQQFKK